MALTELGFGKAAGILNQALDGFLQPVPEASSAASLAQLFARELNEVASIQRDDKNQPVHDAALLQAGLAALGSVIHDVEQTAMHRVLFTQSSDRLLDCVTDPAVMDQELAATLRDPHCYAANDAIITAFIAQRHDLLNAGIDLKEPDNVAVKEMSGRTSLADLSHGESFADVKARHKAARRFKQNGPFPL